MSLLDIDIRHQQGEFMLCARFQVGPGLTVLFGPSGSGKTTMVNAVAGLLSPDAGHIRFGEHVWSDAGGGHFVPPHRRRIGYVFQEARLFPHMSVAANLRYGARFVPKGAARESLERISDLLRLTPLLRRMPAALSGGERQRVALGRALMASPRLLLMDEPLSALDHDLKQQILPDMERIRDEARVPILYVTHSLAEMTRLASRIVTMEKGRAELLEPQQALPELGDSRAGSFIQAEIIGHDEGEGVTLARCRAGTLFLRRSPLPPGTKIRIFLPASDVIVGRDVQGALSSLNRISGAVQRLGEADASVTVDVDCAGDIIRATVTRQSMHMLGLAQGTPVTLFFKAVAIEASGLFRQA
ncbi:molybdenum ABC transporter ATP-binding protein [Allorhizobium undicola]|uniref:molybdenum ABC transporter ATP-binding protein n=1 Tax=Allorhizobium undicola TaxID=78527 RepID=UPI00056A2E67|nr:molybdenum ABC transporter ATP-binding protein [Allorhizobium undicola]